MKIARYILLLVVVFCLLGTSVSASQRITVADGENSITIVVPSKFNILTADDVDRAADYFQDLPISKNEVISRINEGVLLDAFSTDRMREIKLVVASDSVSQRLVNFTPLDESEKLSFASTLQSGLKEQGHVFLSQPKIVELSGYSFVKYYARIGDSTNGYSYTSLLTVVGGKSYELTCYDNYPILDQEMIDANEQVLGSLELSIKGAQGEIASNTFQTVISYLITVAAVAVIIYIVYSFVIQLINKSKSPEHIRTKR